MLETDDAGDAADPGTLETGDAEGWRRLVTLGDGGAGRAPGLFPPPQTARGPQI